MGDQRCSHETIDYILALIDSGTFPAGSRLPSAQDLAQKFGVSRASVREAEIVLQAKGRIVVKVGSGAYVLKGSDYSLNGLPKVGAFELTEAGVLFEAESAALAAPIITDETILELEGLASIISGKEESEMTSAEADIAFHNTIAGATNNRVIVFVVDSMWKMRTEAPQLQKLYRMVYAKEGNNIENDHHSILRALRNRDPVEARKAMRAHYTRMFEALLTASEDEARQELKRKTIEHRSRFLLSSQFR